MILAGIDEAGYGPLLGPLVVGCAAFEVPAGAAPAGDAVGVFVDSPPPCLWKLLRSVISKNRSKTGRKLHINDSKVVYTPSAGLKELERSVLAMAGTWSDFPATLELLLRSVAADALGEISAHPWYWATEDERFPIEHEPMSIRVLINGLRAEMERAQVRLVHLAARVLPERQLNRLFAATRNKSNVLFSQAAIHIDALLRKLASGAMGNQLVLFCDQQGGREHYGHLLRVMFEDWALEVISEGDGRAEYRLTRGAAAARVIFCEKAEAQCMPVALASMLCKYLREAMMHRFNAWWVRHLPGLSPTAGYHQDGVRFLADIQSKRGELGITDEQLVRSR